MCVCVREDEIDIIIRFISSDVLSDVGDYSVCVYIYPFGNVINIFHSNTHTHTHSAAITNSKFI
jgi:hypothetical protein